MTDYDDIIHLPHPTSTRHARMSMSARAAQFAPFAALTGFGDVLRETRRLTETRAEPDEYEKEELDRMLRRAVKAGAGGPEWEFVYFRPDAAKSGGAYVTVVGRIRRIDAETGDIVLTTGLRFPVGDLFALRELGAAGDVSE